MKCITLALAVLLNLPVASPAAASTSGSDAVEADKQQVLAAIRGRLDALAKRDFAAWAAYVSDRLVAPLGGSKRGLIAQRRSWPADVKYYYGPLEDVRIEIFADTAIVSYIARQLNEIGGQTTYERRWQIETHIRQGGKWLLAAVGDAVIPTEPVAVAIDPAVYNAFVGRYEWSPTLISTVSRDGDRLIEDFNGGKSELLPESATTFFVKGEAASGDSSRVIFVKGADGRVTHYVFRTYGGTDRIVKKTK
jgi:uncharacterized protein DUF3471/uncharacterized protein DUF4440